MQGSTIATKNVALRSTDVNSTTGLEFYRYGGEGGIRTHGLVSPTLAFEASSFDRSDASPRRSLANDPRGHNSLRMTADGAAVAGRERYPISGVQILLTPQDRARKLAL